MMDNSSEKTYESKKKMWEWYYYIITQHIYYQVSHLSKGFIIYKIKFIPQSYTQKNYRLHYFYFTKPYGTTCLHPPLLSVWKKNVYLA